jgi:putative ABC transport system permease protein
MLSRIVGRSLTRRRRSKLLSVLAVTLGIAVATAVATIALDVGDKVSRELRSFGANISISPVADSLPVTVAGVDYRPASAGAYLDEADLAKLTRIFWHNNILGFAPFLYLPAALQGRDVVLIGTWFAKRLPADKPDAARFGLKALHPAWKVECEWPEDQDPAACLVGRRLAESLGVKVGQTLRIDLAVPPPGGDGASATPEEKRERHALFTVRGILDAGGAEDDQVLAPLAAVQGLSGLEGKVRRVELSALTKPQDAFARSDVTRLSPAEFDRWYCSPYVSSIAYQIQEAIPGAEAHPVYQVAESEGNILGRVGSLMALLAAAALVAAALAVASMMMATVLERRAEIGLFKSLGATDARVASIFLLEASGVGLLGGVAGYFAGTLMARQLGEAVFGSPTSVHWVIFPPAMALALIVTLAGSAVPLARGLHVSPVTVLRNE